MLLLLLYVRTLKIKIYKYTNSVSRNLYIDKLDDIVNKRNNIYRTTIKNKTLDEKSTTYMKLV